VVSSFVNLIAAMKLPFAKAKTVAELQKKLDAARQQLQRKDEQIKEAQSKTRAARDELHTLQESTTARPYFAGVVQRMDARELLSLRFLKGEGLEIGALSNPTPTRPGTRTKYYDYLTAEQNRKRVPQLANAKLVEPDYLGDGEKLELIADGSLDYLIANHMLEHCQNVIGTLRTFWKKLKPGGALLLAIPDKRYTFDYRRPITPFEHLEEEAANGAEPNLYRHYVESRKLCDSASDAEIASEAEVRAMSHVDIHFHVWTQADLLEMMLRLRRDHGFGWEFEGFLRQGIEVVIVLVKEQVELGDRAKPETRKKAQE
jgi:predicted SAM-dependent methyltransferase